MILFFSYYFNLFFFQLLLHSIMKLRNFIKKNRKRMLIITPFRFIKMLIYDVIALAIIITNSNNNNYYQRYMQKFIFSATNYKLTQHKIYIWSNYFHCTAPTKLSTNPRNVPFTLLFPRHIIYTRQKISHLLYIREKYFLLVGKKRSIL